MNILVKKMGEKAIIPQCHNGDWTDLYLYAVEILTPSDDYEYYTMGNDIPGSCAVNAVNIGANLDKGTPIFFDKGSTVILHLGVAMKMPNGFEGHLLPRSSTYQKTGLLMTNSMGIIDNSYCGDNDEWMAKMYATRDSYVELGARYHQFRIVEKSQEIIFTEVDTTGCADRKGFGSTGTK